MSTDANDTLNPFRLAGPLRAIPTIGPLMMGIAERALAFERLARIYTQLDCEQRGRGDVPAEFARRALDSLQVNFAVDGTQLDNIPAQDAAVVVANHPFGGLEALFLIWMLMSRRSDVRIVANDMLMRIPQLRDILIPVDAFGGKRAAQRNAPSLRRALKHVRGGGLLVIFPAGEVSHLQLSNGRVCDPAWSAVAARLVRLSGAPAIPVYFGGNNGLIFQAAGLLHPRARTILLSRELLNKRRRAIPVAIGRPLSARELNAIRDDAALASMMRLCVYALEKPRTPAAARIVCGTAKQPLASPIGGRRIAAEVEELFAEQTLAHGGELRVVFAKASQIPWTLRELGRLRELAFRSVGEGTGNERDIDSFDSNYTHLILWHELHAEIAGAYRIGHVDELTRQFGRAGLYTHTLFEFGEPFLKRLGPALEVGRSFVRPEYQKTFAALLLLWRGIGAYVLRHPRYRVLFGPVSISADYRPESRALLVDYLRRHHLEPKLNRLVRPRRAYKPSRTLAALDSDWPHLGDADTVASLLARIETDGKSMPVLLKQYLKLSGKLVGFNVDARFGDSIDALIVVDLMHTELRTLQKYMGAENTANYLKHHGRSGATLTPDRQPDRQIV